MDMPLLGKEKLLTFTHETLLKMQILEIHVDNDKTYSYVITIVLATVGSPYHS